MTTNINANEMRKIRRSEHEIMFNDKAIFSEMGLDMYYPPEKGKEFLGIDPTWSGLYNQWVRQNGVCYRLEAITVDGEKKIAVFSTCEEEKEIYIWDFEPENIELANLFLRS